MEMINPNIRPINFEVNLDNDNFMECDVSGVFAEDNDGHINYFMYLPSGNCLEKCELIARDTPKGYWNAVDERGITLACIQFNKLNERCYKIIQNGLMQEFDRNGERIYKGECLNSSDKEYPRNGQGISYKNGKIYYSGQWEDNFPKGEGTLYENEIDYCVSSWEKGSFLLEDGHSKEYEGDLIVTIKCENDWGNIYSKVTELVISEGVCNDMNEDLMIKNYSCLKSVSVMKNSMKNLKSLKICDCKKLEEIRIEGSRWDENSESCNAAFECVKTVEISGLDCSFPHIWSSSISSVYNR